MIVNVNCERPLALKSKSVYLIHQNVLELRLKLTKKDGKTVIPKTCKVAIGKLYTTPLSLFANNPRPPPPPPASRPTHCAPATTARRPQPLAQNESAI